MFNDIEEILISEADIQSKIKEMAAEISESYVGKELLLICVLKGAAIFMADLCKSITIPMKMDFMAVSSYGSTTESSGVVRILKDLDFTVTGKHILIVEDIVDTGLTLQYLKEILTTRNPESVKVCSLLEKPSRRIVDVDIDFLGFQVPDKFVVGYGLDYNEKYRNLPYICVLKTEAYAGKA